MIRLVQEEINYLTSKLRIKNLPLIDFDDEINNKNEVYSLQLKGILNKESEITYVGNELNKIIIEYAFSTYYLEVGDLKIALNEDFGIVVINKNNLYSFHKLLKPEILSLLTKIINKLIFDAKDDYVEGNFKYESYQFQQLINKKKESSALKIKIIDIIKNQKNNNIIFVSEGKIKVYDVMNKTLEIMKKETFRKYLINLVQLDEEIYEEN